MADLYSRNVNTKFSGLTTTIALFGVVGVVALVGFETFRQMRRLPRTFVPPFWKKDEFEQQGGPGGIDRTGDDRGGNVIGQRDKLTCEDWEMGHLYLARQFHATTPSPRMARWPFAWAWQALKFDDWFYARHSGMDTVVYVRFLRACMWWMLLHTLTTAPILLALHFHYAVQTHKDVATFTLNDMSQASLSYLVTTTVCVCADGTEQSTPCADKSTNTTADTSGTSKYFNDYAGCEHRPNESGRKLLWVHLLLAWFVSFSWFYALWWIAKGSLRVRRRWIEEVRDKRQEVYEQNRLNNTRAEQQDDAEDDGGTAAPAPYVPATDLKPRTILEEKHGISNLIRGDDHDGWRQRTLLITNLPPTMRDEASIRRYFEEFLRPDDSDSVASTENGNEEVDEIGQGQAIESTQHDDAHPISPGTSRDEAEPLPPPVNGGVHFASDEKNVNDRVGPEPDVDPERHLRSPVQTVVLVRKMNELSSMLSRRQDVLAKLEAAHIKLAQTVMSRVGSNSKAMRQTDAKRTDGFVGLGGLGKGRLNGSKLLRRLKTSKVSAEDGSDLEKSAAAKLSEEKQRLDELTRRLARFSPHNRGIHVREAQTRTGSELGGREMYETVWEALSEVPRELLDPYQPVTRLSSLFRGQKVPTIDYLLTKLNLLTALVTEMRARPPSSYEPTSTAFVTFRDPRQARMVWRELKAQIVVKVRLAPEVKDLDWERLMRTSFTGDIVRGLGVNTFFWIFTIIWVIPVTLLTTSLFSVEKLTAIFPVLNTFFADNPRFEGFVSVTLPTIIVSLLTLAVPELIFQISKRAQGFVTFSALYDQCLCRYWKFIICNVVIFFCIGATTVQSIIFQLGTNNNVLNAIAFSFPTAAPFYISYLILGMGVHTGFELFGFMIPLIQHLGARNAATPRTRALKTLPRNFNRYYWLPIHILIMSIAFLFAILNPLILPFALAYLWVALAVFKKNFAYQYFRRFNEKEGVVYFTRLLRFSLDGLLLAQIVLLIFFSVTRQEGAYIGLMAVLIPFNVGVKLMGTRLWKSQCRAVEDEEANALCGIGSTTPMSPSLERDYMGQNSMYGQREQNSTFTSPLDARASGRYPALSITPASKSRIITWWNKIHDSFHANGNERPGAMAIQHNSRLNVKSVSQVVASAPISVAKRTATKSRHLAHATSVATSAPSNGFNMRKSLAISSAFPEDNEVMSPNEKQTAGPIAGATARDLKKTLEHGEEMPNNLTIRRITNASHHGRRTTSGEYPYLSGYDALVNHAPVDGDDDASLSSYGDGEFEEMLSLRRRETAKYLKRRRSKARQASFHGNPPRSSSLSMVRSSEARDPSSVDDHQHPLRTSSDDCSTKPFAVPTSTFDEGEGAHSDDVSSDIEDYDSIEGGPLVKPHAKVRWDDTPNNHARYNNPFYSVELDPFLWLPRDPLAPIDLCDTIEWHGAALVSSQGGQGRVGEWEDEEEQGDEDMGGGDGTEKDMSVLLQEEDDRAAGVIRLHGDETIAMTGALAQRLQEAEEADEAANPADSIPRNQLDDFKRALDEEMEAIAEEDGDQSPSSPLSPTSLRRIRSPRRTASASRRSASITSEPFALEEENTPLTGKADRTGDSSSHQPITPQSPEAAQRRTPQRRSSLVASSVRSVSSTAAGAHPRDGGEKGQRVSMQRALKAEVLEEEYLRTVKERVAASRSQRRSDNASALSTTQEEAGEATSQASDAGDQGLTRTGSAILLGRHGRTKTWLGPSKARRPSHSSTTHEPPLSPILRSASQRTELGKNGKSPSAALDTSMGSSAVPPQVKKEEKAGDVPLQDLSQPASADGTESRAEVQEQ